MRDALLLCEMLEETTHPVRVAGLRSTRIVAGPHTRSQLLERRNRIHAATIIHNATGRLPMPVGPVQKVDEVDPKGLLGLPHLPFFASTAPFELFAEPACPVRQRLIGRGPGQELPHPADEVGLGLLAHELRLQQVLPELL